MEPREMAYSDMVRPDEMADAGTWLREMMTALTAKSDPKARGKPGRTAEAAIPAAPSVGFGFTYAGKSSREFLARWTVRKQVVPAADGIRIHRVVRTDPRTGLAVTCEIKEYTEFPVIEWVLRLKNTSKRKTPLIENVHSLDLAPKIGPLPYLHHSTGDYCVADGYEPFRVSLAHGEEYRFAPLGGRPTNRAWPYYNVESPAAGRGMIVVVGWAGQWTAQFKGLRDGAVQITAGQELTRFKLLPGEDVRTPLSVLVFYRGDHARSQNLWRRWMMAHNLPRPGGRLPEPMLPAYTGRWFNEMGTATEETQIAFLDRYLDEGIRLDYWWMDAGWYPCGEKWWITGTWEPDAKRFPRGLRAVCDHAHAKGIKTLVWFEPERVMPGTWLHGHDPEWLLSMRRPPLRPDASEDQRLWHDVRLLNLGHPKARRWLTDHTSRTLTKQAFHHSLSLWLPYYGAYCPPTESAETVDAYAFRSALAPMTMLTHDLRRRDVDWGLLRKLTEEWRRVTATGWFYGDYYPLTPYSRDETHWMAWQFHRPDRNAGIVQVFRRKDCRTASACFCLSGLDPDATYAVTDADAPEQTRAVTGRELMERGLTVETRTAPQAVLLTYERGG